MRYGILRTVLIAVASAAQARAQSVLVPEGDTLGFGTRRAWSVDRESLLRHLDPCWASRGPCRTSGLNWSSSRRGAS